MKRKSKLNFDELRQELLLLQEHELLHTLGGQNSTSGIEDLWGKLNRGEFDELPSGKYDFNTGEFTPFDELDLSTLPSDIDWHITIEAVEVSAPAPQYPDPMDYGYGYDPGMDVFHDFLKDLINDHTIFWPSDGGSGTGNVGGGGSSSGVYYFANSNQAQSIIDRYSPYAPPYETPPYGPEDPSPYIGFVPTSEFPTESDYLSFLSEHYSNQFDIYDKYFFSSDSFTEALGIDGDSTLRTFLDANANNSNIPPSLAREYFSQIFAAALNVSFTGLDLISPKGVVPAMIGLGSQIFTDKFNTAFEYQLFDKYWYGDTSLFSLNETGDFAEILAMGITYINDPAITPRTASYNGIEYKFQGISLYDSDKYDFGLGSAVGIFNENNELVGIFDQYNFNPGTRGGDAEFATRLIHAVSPFYAEGFDIYGGTLPSYIYEQAKEFQKDNEQ